MVMGVENADVATKPLECSPENKEDQKISSSIWDGMKESACKPASSIDDTKSCVPEFLDFSDSSIFCSSFDAKSSFKGTKPGAPKDIEPELYTIKKDDTLTDIAKKHLGPDATPVEIEQHIKEIAKLNGISNPDVIKPGKQIELPGRTADGGKVLIDDEGTKTTQWKDGRIKEVHKDGTGFEKTPDGSGGYTEKHFGPSKDDRYTLTVAADGMRIVDDGEGNKVTTWPNGNEIAENKNGTGHFRVQDANGKFTEQRWGPNPEDRYTLEPKADGSYKGKDEAGNTHTRWDDGTERTEYKDGRGYVSKPDATGGRAEHHWGPRPEDNFEVKRTPDGKVDFSEKIGDAPHPKLDDPEVNAERQKLHELAEKKINDPGERAKFEADMARFEDRANKMEELYKKQGMSPEEAAKKARHEVAETYRQVEKLMEAPDNPSIKLNERDRVLIAEQVMNNAATPTSIAQGMHPTCNVTTVETRTYTQQPSEAAKLVTDVATTGSYVTKDGSKVTVDPGSLEAHDQAKNYPPLDGQRGHASQIFQVTAVNVHYQRTDSKVRYEQQEPSGKGDNGERLIDYSENPPKVLKAGFLEKHLRDVKDSDYHAPMLSDEEIVGVGQQINGDSKNDWYIRNGSDKIVGKDTVVNIESEKQLEDKIKEAKEKGNMPIVVKVHSGNEPFYSDSGAGRAGGSGGWHVVTITDYDPTTHKVAIDNQWRTGVDHGDKNSMISVHDLYLTTKEPTDSDQLKELAKDVKENRRSGNIDYFKEAELLRLKHNNKDLNDKEYKDQLKKTVEEASEKWKEQKANHTLDADQYERQWGKLRDQMNALPSDQRMELMEAAKNKGFYDNERFYQGRFEDAYLTIELQKKQDIKDGKFDEKKKAEYERASKQIEKMLNDIPQPKRDQLKQRVTDASKD